MKTIAFFGHSEVNKIELVKERLYKKLIEIIPSGYFRCLIGRHGDFDKICLSVCKEYKVKNNLQIEIIVVLTSLNELNKNKFSQEYKTMIYDIEEVYYKNQINVSNRKMVDESDLVVCYVNMRKKKSGAKNAVKYAIKQGKEIINLYEEEDDFLYGLSKEEVEIKLKNYLKN